MGRLVSWPMYAVDQADVARFWLRLRLALLKQGFADVPDGLTWPEDPLTHWRDPALLLSQTCGFPFMTSLAGQVRYVATPRFTAPGCDGAFYRSAVVVRRDEPARSIADLAGCRVAFNSEDSQSGTNALRALVAPHARQGRFFGAAIETGGHRRSLWAVASGEADLASIDVVSLALVRAHAPQEVESLRVLCLTASAPGLPFVTAAAASDDEVARLRAALAEACRADDIAAQALLLDGIEVLPSSAYGVIPAMRDDAIRLGYPALA